MRTIIVIALLSLAGCATSHSIGLYNRSREEIRVEIRPNIHYGEQEKFIGLYKDSTGRGLLWQVGEINAIKVFPKSMLADPDTLGIYIMRPNTGFKIGFFYKPVDVVFDSKALNVNSLIIYSAKDTLVLKSKEEIWRALNYNKKVKPIKGLFHDRAIIVY
jgi:hypothetical protein